MVRKNKLAWLQCMFGQNFTFLGKYFEKIQDFLRFECKFNQISYILAKFHQIFNTKKMKKIIMEGFHLHQKYCFQKISIVFISLFDFYDLLLKHFVS
jgi:hypothetical protein